MQKPQESNIENILVLNTEILRPCDIVLSAEKNAISKLIRIATHGKYSHAMLYIGNTVLHATQDGIHTENPQRMQYSSTENVVALRLKSPLSPEASEAIIKFACRQVSKEYGLQEATAVVIGPRPRDSKKQFCSRLIAQAYREVGIQIVPDAEYCSPQDILSSDLFEIVENSLRSPHESDLVVAKRLNIVHQNRDALYSWISAARKLAKKEGYDIGSEEDVQTFLVKYPQYADKITNHIRTSGYLDTYKCDELHNPYRFSIQECKKMVTINKGEAIKLFIHDSLQEFKSLNRFSDNLKYFSHQNKNSYILVMQELYINLIDFSLRKLKVFEQILREEQHEFSDEIFKRIFQVCYKKKQCEIIIKSNIFG